LSKNHPDIHRKQAQHPPTINTFQKHSKRIIQTSTIKGQTKQLIQNSPTLGKYHYPTE